MLSSLEKIILVFVILATAAVFLLPVIRRIRIILAGRPLNRSTQLWRRLWYGLTKALLQLCTLKNERAATGLMHVFIFYGALSFDTLTVNHTLEGFLDNFYLFGNGLLGQAFSFWIDLAALLVMVGVLFMAFRRFIIRPKAYATTRLDSALIYLLIAAATLSFLYFETFAIAHHPETARLSFLGKPLADLVLRSGLSPEAVAGHFKASWWTHLLVVFGFIAYVPHSKYFHMFIGPVNLVVHSTAPSGALRPLDIEKEEIFGAEKVSDFNWKDYLDSFACMECGRCQDVCPAFRSDKPLSPKMIIYNLEGHLLSKSRALLARKRDDLPALVPEVHSEGEIWTCTTCGACRHVCPVEIEHIPKIVALRQAEVLMKSQFPAELNAFFRNLETNSNPWGIGFSKRSDWTEGLEVKHIKDVPQAEYLFWVGCAGSFDEEGKKISRALVTILNKAGIRFGILGADEKCCGDSARRLGQEYLYQTLAAENIGLFHTYGVRKILTICPHGFNTFKNEYPALAGVLTGLSAEQKAHLQSIEVIHHVQLLDELLAKEKLPLRPWAEGTLTYHDSCYLGRHNNLLDEPRRILNRIAEKKLVELEDCGRHSFCCGAGGGLMWTEEKLGRRVNHLRTEHVLRSGAATAATSCPFCQTMLRDGLKDKNREDIKVKDIAQMVADCLSD